MHLTIPDPSLVLLVGPAGAGKSTFAHAHFKPAEIVSSDALRQIVSNDPADQEASADAFKLLALVLGARMKRRLLTVVDATSLRAESRRRYRSLAARYGVPVVAIAFDLPPRVYHDRNIGRAGRVVEDEVVDRQIEMMALAMTALPGERYAAVHVLRDSGSASDVHLERVRGSQVSG